MKTITLDIETLPTEDPDVIKYLTDNLTAPGNYKDPVKIAEYIENNKDEVIRKTSLSGLFGRVYCLGCAVDDDDPMVMTGDEKEILLQYREIHMQNREIRLIGHNINQFDIPFICQRMMINNIKPIYRYDEKAWNRNVVDTMEMIAFGTRNMISLQNLCLALGVQSPKNDLDGSKVYDYYLAGRHQEVYEYCSQDVVATRECYKRLTGVHSLAASFNKTA